MVKRRIPSDGGGSRVCCLLLLFLELLPPHQLLVSVRPRLKRDAASNPSERTPAAPSTCSFRTVGSTRVDALWQPDRPSARHHQLGAREPSCDWCRPGPGPPSEVAGEQITKKNASLHRSSWSSLISPSCPYLRLFLVPAYSHMTTTSTHPKQRQRKSLIFYKFGMDLLIWVVVCFLPDLRCDLLYPTGRTSLTGSDGAVTLSCSAEWCITGTRAHSHGVRFICYNNISAALAYLIYSLDPLRGLQSAHFQADNGGFTIKTSPCFDVLIAHYCYLDLTPGSRGHRLLAVSPLNVCFLNKGLRDFGTEKGSAFRLESWMERLNQVCFCPDPHMRLDSIGMWMSKRIYFGWVQNCTTI